MSHIPVEFTKEMRKTHTIYMPNMLPYHNDLLRAAFQYGGYRLKIVPEYKNLCQSTFSTVNKDYCTCALYIVGNLLTMLEDKRIDPNKIAFLEPQAGGSCRAGNYYDLIIECLKKAGYKQIPVISLNAHGMERHSGFQIHMKMVAAALAAVCYSDLLMTLTQQIKPYEICKGETATLHKRWLKRLYHAISHGQHIVSRRKIYEEIIRDFSKIKVQHRKDKKKVGIVGEIYIKFSPVGNSHLEQLLESRDCEYRQEGFLNYLIYVVYTEMQSKRLLGEKRLVLEAYNMVIQFLCRQHREIADLLSSYHFKPDGSFYDIKKPAGKIIDEFYNIGDGWLITAEAIDLIKQGYDKILVVHPFGCLVSHVGGRGVIKKLNTLYPQAKVSSIEYDMDQSNTLRESRILLAIS